MKKRDYTYKDYLSFPENERWEIVNGIPYCMAAPSVRHQRIVKAISSQLEGYFKEGACESFPAPFDVVFDESLKYKGDEKNVVQPDIIIVCDAKKIENGQRCEGTPDLIFEITSSNKEMDFIFKSELYGKNWVLEYYVIDCYGIEGNEILFEQILKNPLQPVKSLKQDPIITNFKNPYFKDLKIDLSALF